MSDITERVLSSLFHSIMVGRGLRLPMTQELVQGAGAAVLVSSTPGEGTCVRVLLPSVGPSVGRLARE
jgi:signal transduction histidine kinase